MKNLRVLLKSSFRAWIAPGAACGANSWVLSRCASVSLVRIFVALLAMCPLALADIDGDGLLDVVACALVQFTVGGSPPESLPDVPSLVLLRQTKPGVFEPHTLERGGQHVSLDLGAPAGGGGGAGSGDAKWQEVATKLDLAKAYQDMGDKDGARELLNEVMKEGDAAQQGQAQQMLSALG